MANVRRALVLLLSVTAASAAPLLKVQDNTKLQGDSQRVQVVPVSTVEPGSFSLRTLAGGKDKTATPTTHKVTKDKKKWRKVHKKKHGHNKKHHRGSKYGHNKQQHGHGKKYSHKQHGSHGKKNGHGKWGPHKPGGHNKGGR